MTKRFLTPISTNHVDFNTSHPSTLSTGRLYWNNEKGTLDIGMNNDVSQSLGMQLFIPPTKNTSGVEIPKGSFVMATGAQGDRITIAKAVADGSVEPEYMLGVAAHTIGIGSEDGLIMTNGTVTGINTNGWAVGTILYPDPNNAGGFVNSRPSAPNLRIPIAIVLTQHTETGRVYVRMSPDRHLSHDFADVQTTSLTNGNILIYNSASGIWENSSGLDGGSASSF